MNGYGVFAKYYDKLTENVNYKGRADYVSTLLSTFGVKGGTVVDLACGTGSLTYELLEKGFDVIGVDASSEMLSVAQQKAFDKGIDQPMFLCQPLEELDLYGTANAAICMLDSVNHITELEGVKRFFKRLYNFLNPSGLFVFDVNTIYKHKNILGDNTFVQDYEDVYCVWQNSYNPKTDIVDITLDFFEENNGVYIRSNESFSERAYSINDINKQLNKSGFEVLAVYEDMMKLPVTETTQRAVFVAKKI